MKTILYVVSNLKACGPTNQLSYILKYLDPDKFRATVVTLSPEGDRSDIDKIELNSVSVVSLGLGRIKGIIYAKKKLKEMINLVSPDVIHTQGIRSDALVATLDLPAETKWVLTSRNFPPEDYPMKYGFFLGWLMARKHLKSMRACPLVIACSNTMKAKLADLKVNAHVIPNGVEINSINRSIPQELKNLIGPIFVSVGSLIKRKNTILLINAFNEYSKENEGSLLVIGDGPERDILLSNSGENVIFTGAVKNVDEYLAGSNYFLSASLSEGLPNSVLEALSAGLPVILSDIGSHKEIAESCPGSCHIFSLSGGVEAISNLMCKLRSLESKKDEIVAEVRSTFSSETMSRKYQKIY